MTNRQRILAILEGKRPDRIPWIPRLQIWYDANRRRGTLPAKYYGHTLRHVERDLFGGTAARDGKIWRTAVRGVDTRVREHDGCTYTEYVTPVGTVSTEFRRTEASHDQGMRDIQVGFMLKQKEDYPVVEYLIEHTSYIPTFDQYERYEREIGEDGYPLVKTGDCPFHYWMQQLAGYDQAFFHLQDFPEEVERLIRTMTDHYRETIWQLMRQSPARLFQHGIHFSCQMTPPPLIERYILPYYQELVPPLRAAGKMVALHADSDLKGILPLIERSGFGMVECLATSPMVSLTLAEARAAWGSRVIIWGGVPSVILEDPYTDEQFEQYMDEVLSAVAPGDAFILGIADNAMPNSKFERLRAIGRLVREHAGLSAESA